MVINSEGDVTTIAAVTIDGPLLTHETFYCNLFRPEPDVARHANITDKPGAPHDLLDPNLS